MAGREYDVIVIGTGPAGQKAAVAAAKAGRKVLAIEKGGQVGGVCVHSGTIPSKALRQAVMVLSGLRSRRINGVSVEVRESLGVDDLISYTAEIVERETAIVGNQLSRNGVTIVQGLASFDGPNEVRVLDPEGETVYRAGRIIIAAGAEPYHPPGIVFEPDRVLDSRTVLLMKRLPRRLLVIGAGVIGVEYACIFAQLGVQVELTDRRRELLKFVDREVAEALAYQMWSAGIRLRLGEEVRSVDSGGPLVEADLASGEHISCDAVLYVQGREAATAPLRLERAGLKAGKGGLIEVGSHYQTAVSHIYAVGDVIGFPSLASTSMEQGRLAACHALGLPADSVPELLPYGIYSIPEISMVGKSEEDLAAAGTPFAAGRAHYREIARGQIVGDAEGMLKLLFHRKDRRLLGVHAIGEGATELVHIGQAVIAFGGTIDYFVSSVFNYPTFAECYRVAALDGINRLRAAGSSVPAGGATA